MGSDSRARFGLSINMAFALAFSMAFGAAMAARAAASQDRLQKDSIQLELTPRVCTLTAKDKRCETTVNAQWRAPKEESLCLVIVDRPEVKHCWDHYAAGAYSIELVFSEDLTFQLKDSELQHVLASDVVRVIREALRLRHRRRSPWDIFD